MAVRQTHFRQIDVTRAIKAATAGGLQIGKVEIEPAGKIVIYTGEAAKAVETPFDEWKAKKNARSA